MIGKCSDVRTQLLPTRIVRDRKIRRYLYGFEVDERINSDCCGSVVSSIGFSAESCSGDHYQI